MIRLLALWQWTTNVGAVAAVTGAVWAHPVTVRGVRAFAVRVRPVGVESGHIEDTDPNVDTS